MSRQARARRPHSHMADDRGEEDEKDDSSQHLETARTAAFSDSVFAIVITLLILAGLGRRIRTRRCRRLLAYRGGQALRD